MIPVSVHVLSLIKVEILCQLLRPQSLHALLAPSRLLCKFAEFWGALTLIFAIARPSAHSTGHCLRSVVHGFDLCDQSLHPDRYVLSAALSQTTTKINSLTPLGIARYPVASRVGLERKLE